MIFVLYYLNAPRVRITNIWIRNGELKFLGNLFAGLFRKSDLRIMIRAVMTKELLLLN